MKEEYLVEMQVVPQGADFFSTFPEFSLFGSRKTCDETHPENVHDTFKLKSGEPKTINLNTAITLQDGVYKAGFYLRTRCYDGTDDLRQVPGVTLNLIGLEEITIGKGGAIVGTIVNGTQIPLTEEEYAIARDNQVLNAACEKTSECATLSGHDVACVLNVKTKARNEEALNNVCPSWKKFGAIIGGGCEFVISLFGTGDEREVKSGTCLAVKSEEKGKISILGDIGEALGFKGSTANLVGLGVIFLAVIILVSLIPKR